MTDEEFLKSCEGLRFAGPGDDMSKLVMRTYLGGDGLRHRHPCQTCHENIWEVHDGKFYCWNCYEWDDAKEDGNG